MKDWLVVGNIFFHILGIIWNNHPNWLILGNHQARNSPVVNLRGYHPWHVSNKALGDAHQRCWNGVDMCWHRLSLAFYNLPGQWYVHDFPIRFRIFSRKSTDFWSGHAMEHPAGHLQWGAKASREVVRDEAATSSQAGRHVRTPTHLWPYLIGINRNISFQAPDFYIHFWGYMF